VPLRLRSVRINLDRPNFTLNPTNCDPFSVSASLTGDQGAVAKLGEHFQVSNCGTLAFEPNLAFRFAGGTKRTQNPALTATLTAKPGEAGISRTVVALPPSELIDNAHLRNICTRVQFAANACPRESAIGFATAQTPLLEKPLEGPVYLRSAPENASGLPDVVAALHGQIDITLDGKVKTVRRRLTTTFAGVPDAPVTKFTLHLQGGGKGLMVNSENLCSSPRYAQETIVGQNGKMAKGSVKVVTPCGKAAKKKRHAQERSGR
jgi:hypothetical protein